MITINYTFKTEKHLNLYKVYCWKEGNQLCFKCEWCGRIHRHGLGNGPRASHCSKHQEDYEIIETPTEEASK